MKKAGLYILLCLLLILQYSCQQTNNGEKLAERSCGSCHEFPKAELLDKATWKNHVLPRMGAWLGMGDKQLLMNDMSTENDFGAGLSKELIPNEPQISQNDWQLIQEYYLEESPDEIIAEVFPKNYRNLEDKFSFETKEMNTLSRPASNTMIHFDSNKMQFLVAENEGILSTYDNKLQLLDTASFGSVISSFIPEPEALALTMGKMRPNNQSIGQLVNKASKKDIISGLFRPVYAEKADLNNDGVDDFLICNFGYHVGKLAWYEIDAEGNKTEHILLPVAGAIKTKIEDINKDGKPDILVLMAQGNEAIYYFENLGRNEFKSVPWVTLPPVYGSSDFAFEDINGDGEKDIIIACGDNGDFSLLRKPYHGIRFFINDGKNHFMEKLFLPLQGPTRMQVADFDNDNDLDLAITANYADFSRKPQRGFVLYDNLGELQFEPYVSAKTDIGRWLVSEQGDFDNDGDTDLILGSYLTNLMADRPELLNWKNAKTDLLILRNKHIK